MRRMIRISLGAALAGFGALSAGPALAQGVPTASGQSPYSSGMPSGQPLVPPLPIGASPMAGGGGSYPAPQSPGGASGQGFAPGTPIGEPVPGLGAGGAAAPGAEGAEGAGGMPGAGGMAGYGGAGGADTTGLGAALGGGAGSTFSPAAGGVQSGAPSAFAMIGDQAPIFGRPTLPGAPHRPGVGNGLSPALAFKAKTMVPHARSLKMAENQSPVPQDRVFFNFSFYNDLNAVTNRLLGAPAGGLQVYRYIGGFEKTFAAGMGSFGMSESINTLSARSPYPQLAGTNTAMGDVNLFAKYILWQNWESGGDVPAFGGFGFPAQYPGGRNGGLISAGMIVSLPTGPGNFAGASFSKAYRDTTLQPFIGYFFSQGNFYLHGFESVAVPTDPNDVTMLYSDVGVGYYVYRNPNFDTFFTAFAPMFEVHVNIPLNHRDLYNISDPVGTYDVVDLTLGANIQMGQRAVLLLGAAVPVTGPRPFSIEAVAQLNIYFGGRRNPTRIEDR